MIWLEAAVVTVTRLEGAVTAGMVSIVAVGELWVVGRTAAVEFAGPSVSRGTERGNPVIFDGTSTVIVTVGPATVTAKGRRVIELTRVVVSRG